MRCSPHHHYYFCAAASSVPILEGRRQSRLVPLGSGVRVSIRALWHHWKQRPGGTRHPPPGISARLCPGATSSGVRKPQWSLSHCLEVAGKAPSVSGVVHTSSSSRVVHCFFSQKGEDFSPKSSAEPRPQWLRVVTLGGSRLQHRPPSAAQCSARGICTPCPPGMPLLLLGDKVVQESHFNVEDPGLNPRSAMKLPG